ncbi:MAG: Uma2 family endonuclease [Anaerolineales bacterium]|nr:Uma2 family endonuclease [Anaerolineales bacterium]
MAEAKKEGKTKLVTAVELAALPDAALYELVDGELIEMSPTKVTHGRFEHQFSRLLGNFVAEHDLGEVMVGEIGMFIRRNPDTIRAADVLFISKERFAQASDDSYLDVPPELVVEVLSPSESWGMVRRKLRDYFEMGVTVVIIIDTDHQVLTLFRSPTELTELQATDTLSLPDILPGFALPLAKLFT